MSVNEKSRWICFGAEAKPWPLAFNIVPTPTVTRITAEQTIPIRWPILRDGFPRESAIFDGDHEPATAHFGGFLDDEMMGVVSLFVAPCPACPEVDRAWQLRGMATLPAARGAGVGKALLRACEEFVRENGDRLLWCNARVTAAEFYTRHGWRVVSEAFDIPTVGPHYQMITDVA